MEFNKIMVEPLTVNIGAEIHGVDLAKLDDATFDEIHQAFLRYQAIFFREQELTREQHLSFGRLFGKLHIHPAAPSPEGYPEVLRIHADATATTKRNEIKTSKRVVAGNYWHSDVSCDDEPPLGSILYLRDVPETGGDTMFSSMYNLLRNFAPDNPLLRRVPHLKLAASDLRGGDNFKIGEWHEVSDFQLTLAYDGQSRRLYATNPDNSPRALSKNDGRGARE